MNKDNLTTQVDETLAVFKIKRLSEVFTIKDIASAIETETGEKLRDGALRDIQKIMQARRGDGIEPAAIGNQLWKFGNSKPPVRRPIGRR